MGQLALGFRSLLVKALVFVVMAGLLAWALGGTLFPRPTVVRLPSANGMRWQVAIGGDIDGMQWTLLRGDHVVLEGNWISVVGPEDVGGTVWVAADAGSGGWSFWKIEEAGAMETSSGPGGLFPGSDRAPE